MTLVKNKRKFMSATYIGRIMSLGYTIEEIFDLMNNKTFLETIQQVNYKITQRKKNIFPKDNGIMIDFTFCIFLI